MKDQILLFFGYFHYFFSKKLKLFPYCTRFDAETVCTMFAPFFTKILNDWTISAVHIHQFINIFHNIYFIQVMYLPIFCFTIVRYFFIFSNLHVFVILKRTERKKERNYVRSVYRWCQCRKSWS